MIWQRPWFAFLLIVETIIFTSCGGDNQSFQKELHLNIVSDYLDESDTILFQNFCDKNNVRITITQLDANNIIGHFRNQHFNSGFDVIMLNSLYDVNRLSRNNLFHPIDQLNQIHSSAKLFSSIEYNYIGIGIDPYVLTHSSKNKYHLKTYDELNLKDFYSELNNAQLVPLFAGIMPKYHKVGTYNWIKSCSNFRHNLNSYHDTIGPATCLTLYSNHQTLLDDTTYQKYFDAVYLPNQHGNGVFYDLRTINIVYQAENFSVANQFVGYLTEPKHNKMFNDQVNTLPIQNQSGIRVNRINAEDLIQYYVMVERMLTKVDSTK